MDMDSFGMKGQRGVLMRQFSKQYGLDQAHMIKVAKGKLSHHKGFTLRYKEKNQC